MSQDSFNETRAELFEALGHPMRASILEALESKPMGFAEIKKAVGIESSGHLQFHLRKLSGLVEDAANGAYALTDDGRAALRVFRTSAEKTSRQTRNPFHGINKYVAAIAILAILLGSALAITTASSIASTSSLNSQLNAQKDQINSQKDQINSLQSQANSLQSQLSNYNRVILKGDFRVEHPGGGSGNVCSASNCTYWVVGDYANVGGRTAYSANVTFTFYGTSTPNGGPLNVLCAKTYPLGENSQVWTYPNGTVTISADGIVPSQYISWPEFYGSCTGTTTIPATVIASSFESS